MEQGSYLLIEPGMTVQGTDGPLGTVHEVVADVRSDVFRGIVLSQGLIRHRHVFVAADRVVGVIGKQVHVDLAKEDVGTLPPTAAGTAMTTHGKDTVE